MAPATNNPIDRGVLSTAPHVVSPPISYLFAKSICIDRLVGESHRRLGILVERGGGWRGRPLNALVIVVAQWLDALLLLGQLLLRLTRSVLEGVDGRRGRRQGERSWRYLVEVGARIGQWLWLAQWRLLRGRKRMGIRIWTKEFEISLTYNISIEYIHSIIIIAFFDRSTPFHYKKHWKQPLSRNLLITRHSQSASMIDSPSNCLALCVHYFQSQSAKEACLWSCCLCGDLIYWTELHPSLLRRTENVCASSRENSRQHNLMKLSRWCNCDSLRWAEWAYGE